MQQSLTRPGMFHLFEEHPSTGPWTRTVCGRRLFQHGGYKRGSGMPWSRVVRSKHTDSAILPRICLRCRKRAGLT